MELERVEKPLRKLRKLLRDLPQNPPPEEVHKLRTQTRRIEAVAHALEPVAQKETRRLLKTLKPIRKAAGSVRDMDVLTTDLLQLKRVAKDDSLLRLIEYLAAERTKSASRLLEIVTGRRKPARRRLKTYSETIESAALGKKPVRRAYDEAFESPGGSSSPVEALTAQLAAFDRLNSRNLHDFRLKVKELRYLLQTFPQADQGFLDALAAVKDQIGDWHDWQQLELIAREALDEQDDRQLIAEIKNAGKQKLTRALVVSNSLRSHFLQPQQHRAHSA